MKLVVARSLDLPLSGNLPLTLTSSSGVIREVVCVVADLVRRPQLTPATSLAPLIEIDSPSPSDVNDNVAVSPSRC
ncbi:hypothetical protein NDU88_006166 [Pleurodeles waltl]|uniref:Uncharacterized protein n=1 Tax=Pleurodeles waltl TaxID=8319 RepID=A0AAV7LNC6_PLEWA|nr:hypothetical protein NDU88_006166 [Pleurodeles waltl]